MTRIHTHPSRRVRHIPVGMITNDGEIVGEDGGILYCDHTSHPLKMVRKMGGYGVMVYTSGSTRWTRFHIAGTDVFPGTVCRDVGQLIAFRDYCLDLGIHASSIPSMASCIMRNTLPGAFNVAEGWEIPFDYFPNGARIHAVPGYYKNMIQSDITAAYLWGLGTFTPARDFHYTRKCSAQTVADNPGSFAVVEFYSDREHLWGAMPQLSEEGTTFFPARFSLRSRVCATLSSFDIECGIAAGYEMKVRRAWVANPTVATPFSAFMWEMWKQRESSEFPAVAKQAGNTLWGSFCANPITALVKFRPGSRPRIQRMPPRDALCLPIGYSIAAKLRSRLYTDTLGRGAVQAHTDGIISYWGRVDNERKPGAWRIAETFDEIEVLTGSWYRTRTNGRDTYKLAGRPECGERAAKMFARQRERVIEEREIQ